MLSGMEDKAPYDGVFKELGGRYRKLRLKRGLVQEDAMEYGFSVRHYQQLEAGRSHNLKTLFKLSNMLNVDPEDLIKGLVHSPVSKKHT